MSSNGKYTIIPNEIMYLCLLYSFSGEQFHQKLHGKHMSTIINLVHRRKSRTIKSPQWESAFGRFVVDFNEYNSHTMTWRIKMDEQLEPCISVGIIDINNKQIISESLNRNAFTNPVIYKDRYGYTIKNIYYGLYVSSEEAILDWREGTYAKNRSLKPDDKDYLQLCRNNEIKMKLNTKLCKLEYWVNGKEFGSLQLANIDKKIKYRMCLCVDDIDVTCEIVQFMIEEFVEQIPV